MAFLLSGFALSIIWYLKFQSIVLLTQFAQRIKGNLRFNHMIAFLESDCFLVSQESDVIGCYNNTFSLLSYKC